MPDIDFSSYLAARREKQQTPVTVNLAGRDVQFRALFSAEPLITAAVNGEIETDTEQLVINFYRDSLSKDDLDYVRKLASDPQSGFDQDALTNLYTEVQAAAAGSPTQSPSPSSE